MHHPQGNGDEVPRNNANEKRNNSGKSAEDNGPQGNNGQCAQGHKNGAGVIGTCGISSKTCHAGGHLGKLKSNKGHNGPHRCRR